MGSVIHERIEIGGWNPPHPLKIEICAEIDEPINDDILLVTHEYGQEFAQAIAEAFERIFLDRLRNGEYKWARRKRQGADLMAQPAQPATIEDIEL